VLNDGVRNFTATSTSTRAALTGWYWANLTLRPPTDFNGTLHLSVVATATEKSNGNSISTTASLVLTVLPVNDAPVACNASYQLQQDGSVRIDFSALIEDVDGDALSLNFEHPDHGTLTRNSDGSYTYRPNHGFTGIDGFSYTVSDGELAAIGNITLNVGQTGQNCPDGSASIVITSTLGAVIGQDPSVRYIVVNSANAGVGGASGPDAQTFVDWTGHSQPCSQLVNAGWVSDFLGASQDQRTLAQKTGLVVQI